MLELDWFDDAAGNNIIYSEEWNFWVTNGGNGSQAFGSVPVRGSYLRVTVSNLPGSQPISLDTLVVTGTYRPVPYSTFRQPAPSAASVTINGATTDNFQGFGSLNPGSNSLGYLPDITPGTGLRAYLMPLVAGPVTVSWQVSTAILTNFPTIIDMANVTSGNLSAGSVQTGAVWQGANVVNIMDRSAISLPRGPCALVVNPATTSQLFFSAIAQQGY
jgi:hypothetical protein